MNLLKFAFILISAILLDGLDKSMVHADKSNVVPFRDRIVNVQQEAASICTHIEKTMMPMARQFKSLIDDAHLHCPAYSEMEKDLANIDTQADRYSSALTEQLYICQKQLKMLTKGLESGAMVIFYWKAGNYTLSSEILDKWHQSFENFSAKFHVWNIPMDIMLANKRIFYHADWTRGIVSFIVRIALVLSGSFVVAVFLTFVLSRYGVFETVTGLFRRPEQQRAVDDNQASLAANVDSSTDRSSLKHRKTRQEHQPLPHQNNKARPLPPPNRTLNHTCVAFIFFGLLTIILIFYPNMISSPKAKRYNWYPNATTTLGIMKNDLNILQSNVSQESAAIIEFQRYVNIYLDEKFQGTVKEFVASVVRALNQANAELLDSYAAGVKLDSTIKKAYHAVEAKTKKTGKTDVAKNLLDGLKEASDKVEVLHRHLYTAIQQQIKVIPGLKTQTESMRALLRNGRLIEIGELAEKHIDTVINIDGQVHKVTLAIQDVLEIVGSERNSVIEKQIKSLQRDAQYEQYTSWVTGIASLLVGGAGVKITGMGLSMVTVIAGPAVAPAIGAVGILGSLTLGVSGVIKSLSKNFNEADFGAELKDLEIVLKNFMISMQRLEKVTQNQTNYLESARSSLSKLGKYCALFPTISGIDVPEEIRQGITDELNDLIVENTRLIASYSLFTDYVSKKTQIDQQ